MRSHNTRRGVAGRCHRRAPYTYMPRPRCTRAHARVLYTCPYYQIYACVVVYYTRATSETHVGSYVRSRSRMTRVAPHALHRVVPREPFSCGVPTRSCVPDVGYSSMLYIADVACRVRMRSSTRTPRRARARHISALCVARPSRDGFSRRVMGRTAVTVRYLSSRRVSVPMIWVRARVRVRACVCDMTCVKYGCDALVCDTMCVGVCAMCVRALGRTRWRAGTSTAIRATRTRAPRRRLRCLSVCVVFDCAATEKRREARAWVCVSFV